MKDIKVVTANEYNFLHFTSTNTSVVSVGLEKLIQEVVMGLMKTPGRGFFDRNYGVGIRSILPAVAGDKTEQKALSDVNGALNTLSKNIKTRQSGTNPPGTERLVRIKMENLTFDVGQSTWFLRIRVTNAEGESASTAVTV